MRRSGFQRKDSWKTLKRGGRLKPVSIKGQTWIDVRADLKKRFQWAGIVTCEFRFSGCWFNEALGFAHCRKRRKLSGLEIWHVALACNVCHDKLETMKPEEMHDAVHEKIDRRGLLAPPLVQQVQGDTDRG